MTIGNGCAICPRDRGDECDFSPRLVIPPAGRGVCRYGNKSHHDSQIARILSPEKDLISAYSQCDAMIAYKQSGAVTLIILVKKALEMFKAREGFFAKSESLE